MTVVHNHPHPMAQKVVLPTNMAIHAKFGAVRVEDWDDRVAGEIWFERSQKGYGPDVLDFLENTDLPNCRTWAASKPTSDVVRCHSLTTGAVILLHDDWISDPAPERSEDTPKTS